MRAWARERAREPELLERLLLPLAGAIPRLTERTGLLGGERARRSPGALMHDTLAC